MAVVDSMKTTAAVERVQSGFRAAFQCTAVREEQQQQKLPGEIWWNLSNVVERCEESGRSSGSQRGSEARGKRYVLGQINCLQAQYLRWRDGQTPKKLYVDAQKRKRGGGE